jgi:hypothetical protein
MKNLLVFLISASLSFSAFSETLVFNTDVQKGRIALVDTAQGKLVEYDLSGKLTWEFKLPRRLRNEHLSKGADIEWLPKTDTFLFVVPLTGIFEVNRNKEIIWEYRTRHVSHDADKLPNGNIIFVNGWDTESDPTMTEITPDGTIVQQWYASKELSTADSDWTPQDEKNYSFTHANSVTRLENGRTLISLRNFNKYVVIEDNKIIRSSKKITLIHDPVLTATGHCYATRKPNSVVCESDNYRNVVIRSRLNEWVPFRTVEVLKNGNLLISGSTKVAQITQEGNIVWEITLNNFVNQFVANNSKSFVYKATWVYKD